MKKMRVWGAFCVRWRYLIALLFFVFCVAFNLHGSSINEYNKLFSYSENYDVEGVIVGDSRSIRSDEWIVHTPYYMSQQYNDFGKYSHMMSLEGQDMIIGYNAPVADITVVAKPFTWGYFLLGNERGLSWYWCSKLILLMLVTFELCMIITRKNKKISLLGMLMVSFAPAMQWWFVPHLVDVFFWGMAVLVLAYHFFVSQKWWRVLFAVLLSLSMITFALTLFPSLQVPLAMVDIVLLVVFLIRDKKQITFRKKDVWWIVAMVGFVLGVLGYTIITSKEAILALYNTVYPGTRVSLGGGAGMKGLFTDLTSFMLPFREITYSNSCEVSNFIHFAPIFLMLYPIIYKKMKRDKNIIVGNALLVCLIVMATFMLVGFPELLSKITGLSYANRMGAMYGFMATLFTVWGISVIWRKKLFKHWQVFLVIVIYGFLYVCFVGSNELSYLSWKYYAVLIAVLMALAYLMLMGHKKIFIIGMTIVMLLAGATINPVAKGVSALFDHPLEQKIHEIAENDKEAYWLAVGNTQLAAIGIANGAKVINATNFYPDYEKWELLDSNGEYDKVYNRYAHINVFVSGDKGVKMTVISPDAIRLEIGYEDLLNSWPIKYLVTAGELKGEDGYYEEIYNDEEGDYYIYERVEDER